MMYGLTQCALGSAGFASYITVLSLLSLCSNCPAALLMCSAHAVQLAQRTACVFAVHCCAAMKDAHIAAAAVQFTRALAPALFADAADQCCRRYLGAQSVAKPALWTAAAATLATPLYLHVFCKQ
jgi:hypothetical protein